MGAGMAVVLAVVSAMALTANEGAGAPVRVTVVEQPPAAAASGATGPRRIGEPIALDVHVTAPAGTSIVEVNLIATPDAEFVLIGTSDPTESSADGPAGSERLIRIPVAVAAFQVGELQFPGVEVTWTGRTAGEHGTARSGTLALTIVPTVENGTSAQPADIRGPASLPTTRSWWPVWVTAVGLLAAALL